MNREILRIMLEVKYGRTEESIEKSSRRQGNIERRRFISQNGFHHFSERIYRNDCFFFYEEEEKSN